MNNVLLEIRESYQRAALGLSFRSFLLMSESASEIEPIFQELSNIVGSGDVLISNIKFQKKDSLASSLRSDAARISKLLKREKEGIESDGTTLPEIFDTVILEQELTELFVLIGLAARKSSKVWLILINNVHLIPRKELAALIAALHKCAQKTLPIMFVGSGTPETALLAASAKPYAERMFSFNNL